MSRHSWYKTAVGILIVVLAFSWAQPTKAFYLEMPQALKDLFALIKVKSTHAEEAGTIQPVSPPADGQSEPQPPRIEPKPPMEDNFRDQNQDSRMMPPNLDERREPMDNENFSDRKRMEFPPQNSERTCNINGREVPGPCPKEDNRNRDNSDGQRPEEGMNDERRDQRGGDMGFANMKKGIKQMDNNLKRFDKMVLDLEKKGGQVPQDLKDKLARAKAISEAIKSATTAEEMQEAGMDEFQSILQDLEESRQEIFEKAQRLQDVKRHLKGMEKGLKMFENQLARLRKQKITLPADISERVAKARDSVNAIKNAKTWEEVESAGMEDLQDTFMSLDESRQQLEMLSRWPQTLKQIDKELANLNRELKRDKTIVDKLSRGNIDLSANYSLFAEAIAKLKAVRDDAVAKMAAGQSQEAFDALENDFFGQMDDVWENNRIIQTMNNLGRFNQDFKRGMAEMNRTVTKLRKNKIDTAELADLVGQIKAKGEAVVALLKEKPIDQDTVSTDLQELEGLRVDFENKVQELTGDGEDMPWERGPQQFQSIKVSPNLNQYINRKPEVAERETSPVATEPSISLSPLPSP